MLFAEARDRMGPLLLFGRNFLRHPRMLGSLVPSARPLVRRLLDPVDWNDPRVVVEYGPGVGTITRALLARLYPDACLVALEVNGEFVAHLRRRIADPRLVVLQRSAAQAEAALTELRAGPADLVVCGIPLSTLPPADREELLLRTHALLRPGGSLLVYQFTRTVLPDLQRVFADVGVDFEPLNLLPAWVFRCRRDGAG